MSLAIFDLDNTLIGGDSDVLWGEFLVEQKHVDKDEYQQKNHQFYLDYKNCTLNIQEYLAFALAPLAKFNPEELSQLHTQFMHEKIQPILLSKAYTLIEHHKALGDDLLIITATNSFITRPIANVLNIKHILASDAEMIDGRYTGRSIGTPCFQEGKVSRLHEWLEGQTLTLDGSYFYSDSANDIPLLRVVSNPVAVDPDDKLRQYAKENDIPIISLRE